MRPASTVDGVSFYYAAVDNVAGNGAIIDIHYNTDRPYTLYNENADPALANSNAGKETYDSAFNASYGITTPALDTVIYAYVDYSFYLKATNVAADAEKDLVLNQLFLTYNGGYVSEKAWRVAVFAKPCDAGDDTVDDEVDPSYLKSILTLGGAAYFTSGEAVNGVNSTDDVTSLNNASAVIASVTRASSEYFKVTVRLWLEGEDTTCNNTTFATLTQAYSLDLGFTLGTEPMVTNITTPTAAATTEHQGTATLAGATGVTYAWKTSGGVDATGTGVDTDTYITDTDGDYYCIMTFNGNTYRTNIISLTAEP